MLTRSDSDYHLGKNSDTMSSNTISSNPEKPNTSLDPSILAILENIRSQVANLGQMLDRIENKRRDRDCNEDRQSSNVERIESTGTTTDMRMMSVNIKLEVSNFDGRLDLQYYLN